MVDGLMVDQMSEGGEDSLLADAEAALAHSDNFYREAEQKSVQAKLFFLLGVVLAVIGSIALGVAAAIAWP